MAPAVALLLAAAFDLIIGDPRWLPHPVRGIGWLAARLEQVCRKHLSSAFVAGLVTALLVIFFTAVLVACCLGALQALSPLLGYVAAVLVLAMSTALRDLIEHSYRIYRALVDEQGQDKADLGAAREAVAMIVGRETGGLDRQGVVRACVESVAENMSDGVIAPLFWACIGFLFGHFCCGSSWATIGGATFAVIFKAVSTMDSMFGYKNDKYLRFGGVAARLDDAANFFPARLTALAIIIAAYLCGEDGHAAWRIYQRDHQHHASPNAGCPEAAMAGALGLQLAGPQVYFGQKIDKPFIGESRSPAAPAHIRLANRICLVGTLVMWGGCGLLLIVML
jgi:adenosylcobinamide-phosphate synthase